MNQTELLHAKLNAIINILSIMPLFINAAAGGDNKVWREAGKLFEKELKNLQKDLDKYEKANANYHDTSGVEDSIS